jgi:hypothetical protein
VCSLDKAQEIGLDWWRYDRDLFPEKPRGTIAEHEELRAEIWELQARIEALAATQGGILPPTLNRS